MVEAYRREPFQFVLMLGDNIYEKGEIQKYANSRFNIPYKPLLQAGVQSYPTLGNYDVVGGHAAEEISFLKMPGPHHLLEGQCRVFCVEYQPI